LPSTAQTIPFSSEVSVPPISSRSAARAAGSGAVAGGISVLVFTIVHNLFISNIWDPLPMMLVMGALCGASLGWSYALVAKTPSPGGWVRYNACYVVVLVLLGFISLLVFDPVTTVSQLLQSQAPPIALFRRTLPLMVIFTVVTAVTLSLLYRTEWRGWLVLLLTSTLMVFPLGLNVSILGLVEVSSTTLRLLAAMLGLILILAAVYVLVFVGLERKRWHLSK
jgi:hypothetical protein